MGFEKNILVGPADMDSYNIIHHPQYFIWVEESILEWLTLNKNMLKPEYKIDRFQCKFLSPGFLYDKLKLSLRCKNERKSSDGCEIKFFVRIENTLTKKIVIESDFWIQVKEDKDEYTEI